MCMGKQIISVVWNWTCNMSEVRLYFRFISLLSTVPSVAVAIYHGVGDRRIQSRSFTLWIFFLPHSSQKSPNNTHAVFDYTVICDHNNNNNHNSREKGRRTLSSILISTFHPFFVAAHSAECFNLVRIIQMLVTASPDMGSRFYSCSTLSPVAVKTSLLFCQYISSLRNYAHAFRVAYSSLRSLLEREHFYLY